LSQPTFFGSIGHKGRFAERLIDWQLRPLRVEIQ
jgi:hypothetical protein